MIKMKSTSERDWLVNFGLFVLSMILFILVPTIMALTLFFIPSKLISLISSIVYILIIFLIYKNDLIKEFDTFKNNFKNCFKTGLKYYIGGLLAMVFFNMVISVVIKDVSANENAVRDMLFLSPVLTMLSIAITAPLSEELLFRKSVGTLTKNKWIFAVLSGFLFGGAHLLAGKFKLINLLFILPYGSLGFAFALMDHETKSTWTSVMMHAMHNTLTGIMLLSMYFSGALS